MTRILFFLLLWVAGSNWLAADPATTDPLAFVPEAIRAELVTKHEVSVFSDHFQNLKFWKGSPFEASTKELFAGRQSTLAAEAFFLLPVPASWSSDQWAKKIFLSLTSVSTMKDLQVYSQSLKRMETFIFDAYRVGSLNKKDRLADPEFVPDSVDTSFLLFEKEEQTGEGFSRYSFSQSPDWFRVTQTNLTTLKYGIVPLVSPQGLLTSVYIVPGKDSILVYGVTVAKTFSLFGWERSKTDSLYNRMKALVTWFGNNLKN